MLVDFAVVGGGCAGLSLAVALAERGVLRRKKLLILEPRSTYQRDRTFCYWRMHPHPFEEAVSHRWCRWDVRAEGTVAHGGWEHAPYEHIPADRFYAFARERLGRECNVELRLNAQVNRLEAGSGHVVLHTSLGEVRAAHVFDSRPSQQKPLLWQHFRGLHIQAGLPVFNPDVVTLMDFDVDQAKGAHFMYVLPFSRTEALVESTFVTPKVHERSVYEAAIVRYLRERHQLSEWETLHEERGQIPLYRRLSMRPLPNVTRIGAAGGAIKPSTGYAFLSIQRAASAIAERLSRGKAPSQPSPRPRWAGMMDQTLLELFLKHPAEIPPLMYKLFADVPSKQLICFLSDQGRLRDAARVMNSAPRLQMSSHALRALLLAPHLRHQSDHEVA